MRIRIHGLNLASIAYRVRHGMGVGNKEKEGMWGNTNNNEGVGSNIERTSDYRIREDKTVAN